MVFSKWVSLFLLGLLFACQGEKNPVKGEILSQQLSSKGDGYTTIRLWGSYYDMGFAQGALLAPDIRAIVKRSINVLGPGRYSYIRKEIRQSSWGDSLILAEMRGIVDGVNSQRGSKRVTLGDIMMLNTYGDWGSSPPLCRSHSCWGDRVPDSVLTLSSRRLDYYTPDILPTLHHVICIREPLGESRWVNFAFPGYVTVITAVTEEATMVSLHDYQSVGEPSEEDSVMTRCVAARFLVEHSLGSVEKSGTDLLSLFRPYRLWTGTFINHFESRGGSVLTGNQQSGVYKQRVPRKNYFNGEVLITSNSETSGKECPQGALYLHNYYAESSPKNVESHWDILMQNLPEKDDFPLHQVTMEQKIDSTVTIWFQGRNRQGDTLPRVKFTL